MAHTVADLEEALGIIAEAIELYGEAYWPLFDRLESELEARRRREKRLRQHLPPVRARRRSTDRRSPA